MIGGKSASLTISLFSLPLWPQDLPCSSHNPSSNYPGHFTGAPTCHTLFYPLQTFTFLLLLVLTSKLLPLEIHCCIKRSHLLVQTLLVLAPRESSRYLEQYLCLSTCHSVIIMFACRLPYKTGSSIGTEIMFFITNELSPIRKSDF